MNNGRREVTKPLGFEAIGCFLFIGSVIAALAATTLLHPGTLLDHAWSLNPNAHRQLELRGRTIGIPFALVAVVLVVAGVGWFRRRVWGWRLATAIIGIHVVGDITTLALGEWLRGGTGVIIAGALLFYLLRQSVRRFFVTGQ